MTNHSPKDAKTSLTGGKKRLIDSYADLAEVAWQQFMHRRDFEFKITLALWSALAAAVAGSFTIKEFPDIFLEG